MDMSPSPSDSTMSSVSTMMSTFVSSRDTALFSIAWTPSNTGSYAGTCIFLIGLAAVLRGLLSYRATWEHGRQLLDKQRRKVVVTGEKQEDEGDRLRENDIGAGTRRNSSPLGKGSPWRSSIPSWSSIPWRISTDVPRAMLDTLIAGVAYLLMVAVMTMNVGYFCSVLGGIFLGSLMVGRFAVNFVP